MECRSDLICSRDEMISSNSTTGAAKPSSIQRDKAISVLNYRARQWAPDTTPDGPMRVESIANLITRLHGSPKLQFQCIDPCIRSRVTRLENAHSATQSLHSIYIQKMRVSTITHTCKIEAFLSGYSDSFPCMQARILSMGLVWVWLSDWMMIQTGSV